ncbi:MAG: hypothetical protein AAF429_14510 [Pseudomonadota bacterium]
MTNLAGTKIAIYGSSGSGKSTLGYSLIKDSPPKCCVVIDPEARDGDGVTQNVYECLGWIAERRKLIVFNGARREDKLSVLLFAAGRSTTADPIYCMCDEAPGYLDKMSDALNAVFFRGRHRGFGIMVLAQRPSALDTNVRSQCEKTYWLRMVDHQDQAVAAKQIGNDKARALSSYAPGEFYLHPQPNEGS